MLLLFQALHPRNTVWGRQVLILKEFYRVVPITGKACRNGDRMEDTIAISFDDGYRGMLDAFETLEAAECPATGYINSAFASSREVFWRNKLSYLVETDRMDDLRTALADTLYEPVEISKRNIFTWTKKRFTNPCIEKAISKVFADHGDDTWRGIYASWDEIRTLNRRYFTFGNHTTNHLNLTSLTPSQQENQILDCKRELFEELGDHHVGFSVPNGERIHYDLHVAEFQPASTSSI